MVSLFSLTDGEDSLANGKDRNGDMDKAGDDRDKDKDDSVILEPSTAGHSRGGSTSDEEARRREADRDRAEEEKRKAEAERRKADKAEAERKRKADLAEAEKRKAEKAAADKMKADKANAKEMESVRRQLADLQRKLDGNRVDAAENTTSPARDNRGRGRDRRQSSIDMEEFELRREKRTRRDWDDRDRRRRYYSDSREEAMSPYSALGEEGRPKNKTREQINRLGVEPCIALKNWEMEKAAKEATALARPGKRIMEYSKPRKAVEVEAMVEEEADNGTTRLSAARFLRPPESPTSWWEKIPLGWDEGEGQHWSEYNGTRDSMPAGKGCQ